MPEQDFHLFVPFTRRDDEERMVSGVCHLNPTVKSDRFSLGRAALERASAGYMEWGAVREMHQASAAGKAKGLEFTDDGCVIRAHVVDDQAWEKVKAGVYQGFSIGGRPTVTRGDEVVDFDWIETSLVDRPADPACKITLWRAEGVEADAPAEEAPEDAPEAPAVEVTVTAEPWTRGERVRTQDGQGGVVAAWQGEYVAVQLDSSESGAVAMFTADFLTRTEAPAEEVTRAEEETPAEATAETIPVTFPPGTRVCLANGYLGTVLGPSSVECIQPSFDVQPDGLDRLSTCRPEQMVRLQEQPTGLDRGQTSATVPSRENLEGGAKRTVPDDDDSHRRLAGELHYDCGSKTCHGHKQHAAAARCAETHRADEAPPFIRCCDCAMPVGPELWVPRPDEKPQLQAPSFAEMLASQEGTAKASLAWRTLLQALGAIAWGDQPDKERLARESIQQFADYVAPLLGNETQRAEVFSPFTQAEKPEAPLARSAAENTDLLQRLETLETDLTARETELADVRRSLSAAEARVEALAKEPLPITAVAPGVTLNRSDRRPAEREYALNGYDPSGDRDLIQRLKARYAEVVALPPPDGPEAAVARFNELDGLAAALQAHGVRP